MAEYELIDLAEYSRTGEGATAVAYTHKTEPWLAKLYEIRHKSLLKVQYCITAIDAFKTKQEAK